jgi:uncharacterized peroxidase-related enzyme
MAWIKEINRYEDNDLNQLYKKAEERTNETIANVLKIHSLRPDVLKIHMNLYETLMFSKGQLSRSDREMIGVVVSKSNECPYCVSHHQQALNFASNKDRNMEMIAIDYTQATLTSKQLAICDYAKKLTETPYKMVPGDVETLRNHSIDDVGIFEINQIVAYFNYVNRIVFGLGVELEENMKIEY